MKELINYLSNQSVNWSDIVNDSWAVATLFILVFVWSSLRSSATSSRDRYSRTEELEKLIRIEKELSDARSRIAILSVSDKLHSDQIQDLKEVNAELSKQVRKRNPDGRFAVQSGKGHGKKKAIKK